MDTCYHFLAVTGDLFFDDSSHIFLSWHTAPPYPQGPGPFCLALHQNPCAQPEAVTRLLLIKRRGGGRHRRVWGRAQPMQMHTAVLRPRGLPHLEAPGVSAKWGKMPSFPWPPKQATAQDLLMLLPAGFNAFHSMIYSPSHKFPHYLSHAACCLSAIQSHTWLPGPLPGDI